MVSSPSRDATPEGGSSAMRLAVRLSPPLARAPARSQKLSRTIWSVSEPTTLNREISSLRASSSASDSRPRRSLATSSSSARRSTAAFRAPESESASPLSTLDPGSNGRSRERTTECTFRRAARPAQTHRVSPSRQHDVRLARVGADLVLARVVALLPMIAVIAREAPMARRRARRDDFDRRIVPAKPRLSADPRSNDLEREVGVAANDTLDLAREPHRLRANALDRAILREALAAAPHPATPREENEKEATRRDSDQGDRGRAARILEEE